MILVHTTTAAIEDAERIAQALLDEGLAACVQISQIHSRYVWKGKVERADEQLVVIKTAAHFEAVRARLRALHPYETPEIIALPVLAGDPDYLAWVANPSA